MSHCDETHYTDVDWYNRTGIRRVAAEIDIRASRLVEILMASRGRRGGVPTRDDEHRRDEPRREEQTEQQAPAPQGPVLPPPPPVDYGVFMQGLVQAMQTQAHTQAALQAQMEAQTEKKKNATVKKIHLLPPSVQKAPRQVPNLHHAKSHQKAPPSPHGIYKFCHGSVDTPTTGVDTGFQTQGKMMKKWSSGVDTGSSSVDTSPSSQRTQLTVLDSVSTQPEVVSTLDPVPRRPVW
ncbi:hypothetical protein Taro_034066 [Colocasia esculenta]|uniref:Uncharacterized protein n=1 Tax=Colocasia esculenta TaxID=4460 RepID=A0A843W6H8_COLES|nr:hypothetical protein [Colocasia esculenta]